MVVSSLPNWDIETAGLCDFCSKDHPEWIYPTQDFDMAEQAWGSRGAWAACDVCSELIEKDDHEALLDRVPMLAAISMGSFMPGLSKKEQKYIRDEARRLHDKFRRERKGPRRAFG